MATVGTVATVSNHGKKKMISKGTTVTKATVIPKETNQYNPTSALQTKETSSSTSIKKVTMTTKASKATITCIGDCYVIVLTFLLLLLLLL